MVRGFGGIKYNDMNKKLRFEIMLSLVMLILSAALALMSVSLTLPIIVTYFFGGMVLLFAAIITANIYDL
jgi:heme A synthase|tara:strand:- start:377 stop:586 length:210 start_codon:yes stop_codon:yes gene_type:complete